MKRLLFLAMIGMGLPRADAQERLTLEEAIGQALVHNFDLQIVGVDQAAAEVQNTPGEAGMLPAIDLGADVNAAQRNSDQEFADGRRQVVNQANSFGYSAAINLSWTLFDGGKMFLRKRWLDEQEAFANLRYAVEWQSLVARVIESYAGVILAEKSQIAVDTGIALARARMALSQLKYETGSSAKVDYLQARVDYNARIADSLKQVSRLTRAKADLNALMGRDPDVPFRVEDSLVIQPRRQQMKREVLAAENLSLAAFRKQKQLSALQVKIAHREKYPQLSFQGGYQHQFQRSASGFLAFNQQSGPQGALVLNLPIFRGGALRRQVKLASLESMRADILYSRQSTELARAYRVAWQEYQEAYAAYELEKESIGYAREHLTIQKSRFDLGMATSLETREAEASFVDALIRLYEAIFMLKVNETKLLELENELVTSP